MKVLDDVSQLNYFEKAKIQWENAALLFNLAIRMMWVEREKEDFPTINSILSKSFKRLKIFFHYFPFFRWKKFMDIAT